MHLRLLLALHLLLVLLGAPSRAEGAEPEPEPAPVRGGFVRMGFAFTPVLDGSVGKRFVDDPTYAEAFDPGIGGRLELGYRVGHFAALIGGAYDHFDGRVWHSFAYEDRKLATFFFGLRAHLFADDTHALDPYVGLDIGGGRAWSVDFVDERTSALRLEHWNDSPVAMGRLCVGLAFRFEDSRVSIFAEASVRFVTGSEGSELLGSNYDGETSIDAPLVVGLTIRV